jgi:Cd2+/Zn2+-exporting ATPase
VGEWSEGATVAFLFAASNLLESWTVERARRAVAALMRTAPQEAAVLLDGVERRIPAEEVPVGTKVLVRPEEKIPCDGVIIGGESEVDESPVTGDHQPRKVGAGDDILAGSINGSGALEIRTTRAARETTLGRATHTIETAHHGRAPVEQWVERFARHYTPLMIVLAVSVAVVPPLAFGEGWSRWFYQALVVLVIACPCALVISTPVTLVAALTSAARRGVLIKGGAHLETAARLRAVALDKTGSLTTGEPEVLSIVPLDGKGEEEALERIAGLEVRSEHPLARAIVQYARKRQVKPREVSNFRAIVGKGAEGRIEGDNFWVGSYRMLEDRHVDSAELEKRARELRSQSHTVVACGDKNQAWALVGARETVRPDAAQALRALRSGGIKELVILTGDHEGAASAAAREAGVDDVRSGLTAEDKAAAVREMVGRHQYVAMVGDGINDAPAMAAAALGIALGHRATDSALETADVVFLAEDLRRLPYLVNHARRALRVIKQNVAFAVGVKVVFLTMAFAGHGTLWMAIAADTGATLLVILNGLRMLRESVPHWRASSVQ